jgi:isopentenyl phosphate kinase
MESKVKQMLELVENNPELTIQIFSGKEPGHIARALMGEVLGTVIAA